MVGIPVVLATFVQLYWRWIAVAAVVAGLLLWAGAGHRQAKRLGADLAQAQETLRLRTVERDQARNERAAALDAAEACSRSVAELAAAADKQLAASEAARREATRQAQQAQTRAARILATPAAVPGNDAASARARIDEWLKER